MVFHYLTTTVFILLSIAHIISGSLGFKSNHEDDNDIIQVPQHIKSLFSKLFFSSSNSKSSIDSGDRQSFDNRNNINLANNPFQQGITFFLILD